MHTSTTNLAYREEISDRCPGPLIDQDTAAEIVRCRHDGYRLLRNIQPHFQTLFADKRKALANRRCRHVRGNVEQHVRVTISLHLVTNRTGDDVTWGKIFPRG